MGAGGAAARTLAPHAEGGAMRGTGETGGSPAQSTPQTVVKGGPNDTHGKANDVSGGRVSSCTVQSVSYKKRPADVLHSSCQCQCYGGNQSMQAVS